jgi:hypothetical protein
MKTVRSRDFQAVHFGYLLELRVSVIILLDFPPPPVSGVGA